MDTLKFADDIVVITKDKRKTILVESLSNEFEKVGMHINPEISSYYGL